MLSPDLSKVYVTMSDGQFFGTLRSFAAQASIVPDGIFLTEHSGVL
jgi:phosphatidate phosphatase APP1